MRKVTISILFIMLAACGARETLRLGPDQKLLPQPVTKPAPLTTTELLTIPSAAKPRRVDDPLRRSEEREEDRFDLPPPE